ncbi:MAG: hypothetical protein ACRCSQ_08090 [Bacteroidales bacterium]
MIGKLLFGMGLGCSLCISPIIAQENTQFTYPWSLELSYGFRIYEGESDAHYGGFSKRASSWFQLGCSKQITTWLGFRGQISGMEMRGYIPENSGHWFYSADGGKYTDFPYPSSSAIGDGWYHQDIRYMEVGIAAWISIRGIINPHSDFPLDLRPAFGMNYAHVFAYKGMISGNFVSPSADLFVVWDVNRHWKMQLDLNANLVMAGFNGELGENRYNGYWGLSLGVGYKF